MNEKLKHFLESLSNEDADDIWLWLDSTPEAVVDMIEVIVNSHPELDQDDCDHDLCDGVCTDCDLCEGENQEL